MTKTVHRIFFAWDFEKEEKWLNDMSAKGWQLCGVGLCTYVFEKSEAGAYIHSLGLLDKRPTHTDSKDYIRFLEDTGAEYVGSMSNWVYFRKKAGNGDFELLSDMHSRIRHVNRVLLIVQGAMWLGLINVFNATTRLFPDFYHANLWVFVVMLAFISLLSYGVVRLLVMRHRLKKESLLHE